MLGAIATVLAAGAAQVAALCNAWASELTTSLAIPYRPQPGSVSTAALSATLIALAGAALPAWRANRANPVLALREG